MKTEESTTSGSAEETLLGIYLNDHLATLVLGLELARRAARGQQDAPAGHTLERLATELTEDRGALLTMMKALGVPVRQYKVIAAHVAERIGRLKPNGRVLHRSPLSNVVEVEGLQVAIEANAACWRTLREVADHEPRLDGRRLEALLERAQRQVDELEECRTEAAAEAFAGSSAEAGPQDFAEDAAEDAAGDTAEAPAEITPDPLQDAADREPDLPEAPSHDDLPLPDYDHLPKGSLPSRIKSLDREGVEKLLSYELAHANRVPVVLILERRLQALAEPAGASAVSPTAEPPVNALSHGDPTTPAAPR